MLRHTDLNRYKGYNNVLASIKVHGEHLKPTGWTHTDVFKHLLKRYGEQGEATRWACCKLQWCNMRMWNHIPTSLSNCGNCWKWCMCTSPRIRTKIRRTVGHFIRFIITHEIEGDTIKANKRQMNHRKGGQKKKAYRIRRRSYNPCSASVARDPDQKPI